MRRFLFENSLSLFFGVLFLGTLVGQSLAGQRVFNENQLAHGGEPASYLDYVLSSDFGRAVTENWQSEYLQFTVFILATVWLVQKGSNESKPLDQAGLESDQKQQVGGYAPEGAPAWARARGWRTALLSHSLVLAMTVLFLGSWLAQSLTAWTAFNAEQRGHDESTLTWVAYLGRPDFWERTLQNWQSEFLAVGTMAVFTIYLRQRGSPESKPVGAPHEQTGTSG
ncbi:MAG: DUF6766 family protein [Gaiellaceae bacterium]